MSKEHTQPPETDLQRSYGRDLEKNPASEPGLTDYQRGWFDAIRGLMGWSDARSAAEAREHCSPADLHEPQLLEACKRAFALTEEDMEECCETIPHQTADPSQTTVTTYVMDSQLYALLGATMKVVRLAIDAAEAPEVPQ